MQFRGCRNLVFAQKLPHKKVKRVVRPLFINIFYIYIIVINVLTKMKPSEIESIYNIQN